MVLVTSAKPQSEALSPNMSLPSDWQIWENYSHVFTEGRILPAFLGSVFIMVPAVFGVLLLGSMASWILARRGGRLNAVLYAVAISGIILPPAVVTLVLLLRQLGLAGTGGGMVLVYMAIYMATGIYIVTGILRAAPP